MDEIRYIARFEEEYPEKLRFIPGAPAGIYVSGELPDPDKKTVAIVGSRACSEYGRKMAGYFASHLARSGVQVVSGMARGIDGMAQKAALEAGGESFGILGCGVDVIYPKENSDIYKMIRGHGGLISEQPPGTKPLGRFFASRNRIISGIADLLLVIEARVKSGTAITVNDALDQGRDVYAVPGRLTDPLSAGCLKLLNEGAGLASCPNDILKALGMLEEKVVKNVEGKSVNISELTSNEQRVYRCLDLYPVGINEIVRICGLSISSAMEASMSLCLKGMAKEYARNYYIRIE